MTMPYLKDMFSNENDKTEKPKEWDILSVQNQKATEEPENQLHHTFNEEGPLVQEDEEEKAEPQAVR